MPNNYDIIIIGSGAGGGTLAYSLADTGKKILILERGDFLPREKDNWDPKAVFVERKYQTDEIWLTRDEKEFNPMMYYNVGGNTKMYGALLHRQRPDDFTELQHKAGSSPAWPFSYDDFEPYYMMAEHLMKINGDRTEDPTEGWASGPYPFGPFPHEPRIQEVADELKAAGLNPFHSTLALNRDHDEPWRRPCIRCNTCDPFPCMLHAKSDAETSMIRPALQFDNVEMWTHAHVDRLVETDGRISSVELTHNGEAKSLSAELVVVSCGAINSAALLLKSGVANSSGQVGRNFIKHNQTGLTSVHSKRNDTVFQKTLGVHDFYFGSPEHDYPLGTIQLTGKAHWTRVQGDVKGDLPEEQARFIADHAVDFFFTSEDLPDEHNRIELKNGKIKFNYRPNNVEAHNELIDHFRDNYLRPQGFYMFLPWMMDHHVAWHQAGTCRFGEDPSQNVLDLNCKAHDLDNLYVVDASFQPSMGATNPTLTIIANAIRVAEHLRREWLKESAVNLHYPTSGMYMADSAKANVK